MADSDTKPVLASHDDPNPAPPPYYAAQTQPQFQQQPQFYPQPQFQQQPQFYPQPQFQPSPQQQTVNNSTVIITQPAAAPPVMHVVSVPDHLGLAIFSCLCCFWPLGLAAIVVAVQSRDALTRGDLNLAQSNSRLSRLLSLISIGIGVVAIIIIIIVVATSASSYSSRHNSNYN